MLLPPTIGELRTFRQALFLDEEQFATAEFTLRQATDAVWQHTQITEYPADPQLSRILKYAILELATWLQTQAENRDEINSPFSSERIGSYSYSKVAQAAKSQDSGLFWLDSLFTALSTSGAVSSISITSEIVFSSPFGAVSPSFTLKDQFGG